MNARIVLARRASGCDHAVAFGPEALRIEGGFAVRRRIPYRSVHGIERSGPRLWIGAGLVPVGLGGRDVAGERLAAVERELRARIAALPDGAERIARIDRRRRTPGRLPWLSLSLALAHGLAIVSRAEDRLGAVTELLLLLTFGLLTESALGSKAVLVSGAAGPLAAGLAALAFGPAGDLARWAPLVPAAWLGLLARVRLFRETELPLRERSAVDTTALLALGFAALTLAAGTSPPLLAAAALGGFASAPLALHRRAP